MEKYKIRRLENKDYKGVEKAHVDKILWGGSYQPDCFAQVIYVKNDGFYAKMSVKESNPLITYKPGEFSDDVCDDSCMEWFINFAPAKTENYINFEGTAAAALNCCVAASRENRIPVNEITGCLPEIAAGRDGDYWWIEYHLSRDILTAIFGEIDLTSGAEYTGNFYKCGELTEFPHYLAWAQIDLPEPDYHCPEFFGKFILE